MPYGAFLMLIATLAGLATALYDYLAPNTGITGTIGALLVLCTTFVLLLGILAVTPLRRPRWLIGLLNLGIVVDAAGSGFASWLLESHLLTGLLGLTLIGWIIHIIFDPAGGLGGRQQQRAA